MVRIYLKIAVNIYLISLQSGKSLIDNIFYNFRMTDTIKIGRDNPELHFSVVNIFILLKLKHVFFV